MIFKNIKFDRPFSKASDGLAYYKVEDFGDKKREYTAVLSETQVKLSNALVRIKDKISEEELDSLIEAIDDYKEEGYSKGYDEGENKYTIGM